MERREFLFGTAAAVGMQVFAGNGSAEVLGAAGAGMAAVTSGPKYRILWGAFACGVAVTGQ